jgi:hypothetical protein
MFDDKITRLTDTDLWLEDSNGTVTKFRKRLCPWLGQRAVLALVITGGHAAVD